MVSQGEKKEDLFSRKENLKIFDNLSEFVFLVDKKTKILFINKASEKLIGQKSKKVIGKNVSDIFPKKYSRHYKKYLKAVFETGKATVSKSTLSVGSTVLEIETSLSPIKNKKNKTSYVFGICRNITKRIELHKEYKKVFDVSPEAIILFDNKGVVKNMNSRVQEWLGYTPEEIIGKPLIMMPFLSTKSKAIAVKKLMQRVLDKKVSPYELEFINKNGTVRLGLIQGSLVRDEKGKVALDLVMISDVTKRRVAEKKLAESELKFRLAAKSTSDLIYEWNIKTGELIWYGDIDKKLGYKKNEFPRTLKAWAESIHPEDSKRVHQSIEKQLKKGGSIDIAYRIKNKKGNYLHWVDKGATILDPDGKPETMVGGISDITTQKEAEERFKNIYNKSPIGIEIYDSKGSLININKAGLDIFGVSNIEKVKGFKLFEDPNLSAELKNKIKQGKPVKYEVEFDFERVKKLKLYETTKAGLITIEVSITPIVSKEKSEYLVQVQDISARKKAEEKIKEAQEKAERLLNLAGGIIVALDKKGEIVILNRKGYKILGYPEGSLVGKNWFDMVIPKGEKEKMKKIHQNIIKQNKRISIFFENVVITKDKKEKIISWYNTKIKNKKGEVVGTLSSGNDITNLRKAENSLNIQKNLAVELSQTSSLTKAAQIVFRNLKNIDEIDSGGIYIYKPQRSRLELIYHEGLPKVFIQKTEKIGLNTSQFRLLKKLVKNNDNFFGKYKKEEDLKLNYLGIIPLSFKGEIIGSLNVGSHNYDSFSKNTKSLLESIAREAEGAIIRINNERKIRKSEDRYKNIVENINDAMFIHDFSGKIIDVNKNTCKSLGYSRDELIGKKLSFIDSSGDIKKIKTRMQKLIKGGELIFEASHVTKNKKIIPVSVNAKVVSRKGNGLIQSFARDISEQIKAQKEIERAKEKYRILSDTSAEGVVMTDNKGVYRYANPAFEDLSGYPLKEIIDHGFQKLTPNENEFQKIKKMFEKLIKGQVSVTKNNQYKLRRKNGEIIDIEISSNIIKKDEKITGFLSVVRDVSKRKKAEAKLKEKLEELEEINRLMVGRELKMVELKKKVEELEDKLKNK